MGDKFQAASSGYSNVFTEQGAARGCRGHGGAELAGIPGTQVHEQDKFDDWHRESRGLKIWPATFHGVHVNKAAKLRSHCNFVTKIHAEIM